MTLNISKYHLDGQYYIVYLYVFVIIKESGFPLGSNIVWNI